jgi:hypothetical protein
MILLLEKYRYRCMYNTSAARIRVISRASSYNAVHVNAHVNCTNHAPFNLSLPVDECHRSSRVEPNRYLLLLETHVQVQRVRQNLLYDQPTSPRRNQTFHYVSSAFLYLAGDLYARSLGPQQPDKLLNS